MYIYCCTTVLYVHTVRRRQTAVRGQPYSYISHVTTRPSKVFRRVHNCKADKHMKLARISCSRLAPSSHPDLIPPRPEPYKLNLGTYIISRPRGPPGTLAPTPQRCTNCTLIMTDVFRVLRVLRILQCISNGRRCLASPWQTLPKRNLEKYYRSNVTIVTVLDASGWGKCLCRMYSSRGYRSTCLRYRGTAIAGITPGSAAISWAGSTQRCVTLSTSEAECVSKKIAARAIAKVCACWSSESMCRLTVYQHIFVTHPGDWLTRANSYHTIYTRVH